MSRLGFRKVVVYVGEACLGELDTVQSGGNIFQFPNNEIRIHGVSAGGERRCHPLAVLRTISASFRCKLEPSLNSTTEIKLLHAACLIERKTAVTIVNNEELHLVAMPSKLNMNKSPCFWCFSAPIGLYNSCSSMLNQRSLAIVFDLDETLVVAKTMKLFGDRIEALRGQIARELNPNRSSAMTAEMNRHIEDRELLKQFIESDSVVDSGKFNQAKLEYTTRGFRPVIRLLEKNVVLTRIIPENRDTSVLVRLRPGWEGLRSFLVAEKRFEVYVCTMAEKEYALEMWRLLDPNAGLISLDQQMNRVVSIRDGSRKSLLNVFQKGVCHPKMALVIDDRVDVWDDRDKPRVHAVPAFIPHYAPCPETVLGESVRNVAFNVREGFLKEFDESLVHKISEICYEDEFASFPASPDVASYMKDASLVPNGYDQRLHPMNSQQQPVNVFKKPKLIGSQNELPANIYEHHTEETKNALRKNSMTSFNSTDQRHGYHIDTLSMNPQQPVNVFKKPRLMVGSQNQLPAKNINEHRTEETSNHIPELTINALHKIGQKCNSKVEFKPFAHASDYSFEVWFGGDKVGMGTGRTMKDAQLQAADKAIRTLADRLTSHSQKQALNILWTHIGYLAPDPLIGC